MEKEIDIPNLPGYLPIKEVARILGVSERRVYDLIQKKRLHAFRVSDVFTVAEEEVRTFQQGISGRPRQNTPAWRISPANDAYAWLHIFVQQQSGHENELKKKLTEIRKSETLIFPGTAARYIARSDQRPDEVQILLIWRGSMIPEPEVREAALEELQRETANVVDWQTARYETGQVLMHT
jgi:excisionase family DNA binding protein